MQILCYLSPYFKEDLSKLKKSWLKINGKRRIEDLKNILFNKNVKKINCQTILLIGSKEDDLVFQRVNDAHKKISNSKLVVIEKTRHRISQIEYLSKIRDIVSNL